MMHFEIFVEDISGKDFLENIIPKILSEHHTFKIHPYKGIGNLPRNLLQVPDPAQRTLLHHLPSILRAYGKSTKHFQQVVVVICDLDRKCLKEFRGELNKVLETCNPKPETRFCIAIEEGEAWLLGDLDAIKKVYPRAKENILSSYVNDSICGTWEKLADAVYPGGFQALSKKGFQAIGTEKFKWAEKITPFMLIEQNKSPSFNYMKTKIQELIEAEI